MTVHARQFCHGLARLRWAHCADCGAKLPYQVGSIVWQVMERIDGTHRCGKCEGRSMAEAITAAAVARIKGRKR